MPPTKSDKPSRTAKPGVSRGETGGKPEAPRPQKLNLGCGTFILGVCVIVLLGKFLPHPTRGLAAAPTLKTDGPKPAAKPTRVAEAPSKPPESPKPEAKPVRVSETPKKTPSVAAKPARVEPAKAEADTGDRPVVFNSPWNGSVWQVERYLKKSLYDAASFEALEWGKVATHAKGYQVQCKYRSKNVLGVYATQTRTFLLNKSGEVYAVKE